MIKPQSYSAMSQPERAKLRAAYVMEQHGRCALCCAPLAEAPPPLVLMLRVPSAAFPPGFYNHPIHLHHDHNTDLTLGAVHAHCNAVSWIYVEAPAMALQEAMERMAADEDAAAVSEIKQAVVDMVR